MSYRRNFESLEPVPGPVPVVNNNNYGLSNGGHLLAWLIGLTVLFWLIFWLWDPTFVQNKNANGTPNGTPNPWLALLWGFIVAIVIVALIWLFTRNKY